MSMVDPKSNANSTRQPLKERLWKLFGILFYLIVAIGIVYHFIVPFF
jgi:hypothetical protein